MPFCGFIQPGDFCPKHKIGDTEPQPQKKSDAVCCRKTTPSHLPKGQGSCLNTPFLLLLSFLTPSFLAISLSLPPSLPLSLSLHPSVTTTTIMASTTKQRGLHADTLDRYDDLSDPIPTEEQERLLNQLKTANDASNYIYRAALLLMIVLVFVLYLTPIPSYINGTHPENHLTLFHHGVHVVGTEDHLTYLPAFPIYMLFFSAQGYLLYLAGCELLSLMGHDTLLAKITRRNATLYRTHPFGSAPSYLVSILSDIRITTGNKINLNERADQPAPQQQTKFLHDTLANPRLLYLWFLCAASAPLPLLIFGAGNFGNAGWFALTTAVLLVVLVEETWVRRSENQVLGLGALKYDHKSA